MESLLGSSLLILTMKNIVTEKFAINALLLIFSLIILFHGLVLISVIPFEMVWGGRLQSQQQMIPFEIVSIVLNSVMLAVVAIYAGLLKVNINRMVIRVALWCMAALFLLNTIGNSLSTNDLEKLIFTPLTLLLTLFSWRLAVQKSVARDV